MTPGHCLSLQLVVLGWLMGFDADPTAAQTRSLPPFATDSAESRVGVLTSGWRGAQLTLPSLPSQGAWGLERGISPTGKTPLFAGQSEPEGSSGWKKGLLWGGLAGTGAGILAFLFVDAIPCDSCSGTGADSSADGAFLEFALGFGVLGAAIGALVGAL